MRKFKVFASVAAFAMVFGFSALGHADEGATIIEGVGCRVSASATGLPFQVDLAADKTIITPSGNYIKKCEFSVPAGFQIEETIVNSGFPCQIVTPSGSPVTTDTKSVAIPGGKVLITCQIKANQR